MSFIPIILLLWAIALIFLIQKLLFPPKKKGKRKPKYEIYEVEQD